ncbi:DUF6376 family protein [Paenibacillus sp. CC-CFT747]|nr:DUF6376 family protein [Paenibacillus sp. CC-CFT747]
MKEAATNPDAKKELENRLNSMKQDIERFNGLEAPAAAKELHQQLVAKNEVLLGQINDVVNNGHLALDKLQNSQIVQTIQDAAGLIDRIQNLGL